MFFFKPGELFFDSAPGGFVWNEAVIAPDALEGSVTGSRGITRHSGMIV